MRGGGWTVGISSTTQAIIGGGGPRNLSLPQGGPDPTDFFDARAALERGRPLEPLDHVAVAVLELALRDVRLYARTTNPKRRAWYENARAFLFDTDADEDWPLTFERICERFGIEIEAARAAIGARRGSVRRVRLRTHRPRPVRRVVQAVPAAPVVIRTYAWRQLALPFEIVPLARPARVCVRRPRVVEAAVMLPLDFTRRRRLRRAA